MNFKNPNIQAILLNTALPIIMNLAFYLLALSNRTAFLVAVSFVVLLMLINVGLFFFSSASKLLVNVMSWLNLAGFIGLSELGFVTAIPTLVRLLT